MHAACIAKLAPGATGIFTFLLIQAAFATNAAVPQAVSPVGPTAEACPTFSWTDVPEANGYELAVFPVYPNGKVPDKPSLSAWLPAGATSWTPPANACLEAGTEYGWSIRATGDQGVGDWSEPALIEFAVGPTAAGVQAAFATIDQFLIIENGAAARDDWSGIATGNEAGAPQEDQLRRQASGDMIRTRPGAAPAGPAPAAVTTHPSGVASKSTQVLDAAIKVEGEVRPVDGAGQPRLWGKGRPNTVVYGATAGFPCLNGDTRFGLSAILVPWGAAANACPAGTWVCTEAEIVPCDTVRPDTSGDMFFCNGDFSDLPADSHSGWLAEQLSSSTLAAPIFREDLGVTAAIRVCNHLPVWCCWQ